MCFQNEIFLLQSSRNQEMLKEIPSITIQWITLQDNCIRRGYVYYRGQAETFSRFYVLLQTIYCFRFDYAYLCRVYFSTLLLCICIISLGLKLLSSLFSSIVLTLIICILFSKKNAMVWVTLFCFFSANCFIMKKRKYTQKGRISLDIFYRFWFSWMSSEKDTYFMKKLDAFMNK